jgi:hypothetical protein
MRVRIELESVIKSENFKIKEKFFCPTGSYFLFPRIYGKPSVIRKGLKFLQIVQSGSFPKHFWFSLEDWIQKSEYG